MKTFDEIIDFGYEYHDMMVDKMPELYDTNDLDCLRSTFMGSVFEQITRMMFLDPSADIRKVTDDVISNDDFIDCAYEDAIELTKFGCCC